MPYRFEKRKKQLLKQAEKFNDIHSERNFDLEDILQGEEEKIEEEFLKLKDISRADSLDSLMANQPLNIDADGGAGNLDANKEGDENESDDDSAKKAANSASKKEKELAKAYGGKPPKTKKKKGKKKKSQAAADGDRLPTDRVFSYLNQEEDRIKKMAHLTYQIENTNLFSSQKKQPLEQELSPGEEKEQPKPVQEFEDYFKQQMQGIQQIRIQAAEDLNQQRMEMEQQQQ